MRMGGACTTFSMPLASTTLNVRCEFSMIAFLRVFARIFASMERAPHQRKLSEAFFRWKCSCSMRRLLGPLRYLMDLDTRYHGGAAVLQFARCERGDSSFLIGTDLIRKCTGVKMKADNFHLLVDGVRRNQSSGGRAFRPQRVWFRNRRRSRRRGRLDWS
jgi:hypothetical protein